MNVKYGLFIQNKQIIGRIELKKKRKLIISVIKKAPSHPNQIFIPYMYL